MATAVDAPAVQAFGLALTGDVGLAGLHAAAGGRPARHVEVSLATAAELPRGGQVVLRQRDAAGRPAAWVRDLGDDGWLLRAHGFGSHHVARDGSRIRCAPPRGAAWRWQRYLVGQALPFAATLQGLEPLHASAVARDGRALVLTGPTTAGKSSLALHLVARGAEFIADDVVALEPDGERVVAHPGAGVASLRFGAAPALDGIGERLGADDEAHRIALQPGAAAPVAAIAFLVRGGSALRVEETAPDPRLLLASSFNFVVRDPARLARQLDTHARLAAAARVLRVTIPAGASPAATAAAIDEAWPA